MWSSQRGGMINALPRSAHRIPELILLVSVFLLSFVTTTVGQNDTRQMNVTALTLEARKPIDRDLGRDERHKYRINLNAGQYGRLLVEPQAVDIAVVVFGTGGNQILRIESPYGAQEPVFVSLLGNESGSFEVEVLPAEQDALNGHYTINLEEMRAATVQDGVSVEAQALFASGQDLRKKGTGESKRNALENFEQALSLWQKAGNSEGEAETLDQLGALQNKLGENNKAVNLLLQSLHIFQSVGDRRGEAMALSDLGNVENDLGDNQKALTYLNQSLPIRREVGDRRGEAETLENIGTVYENLSEADKALENYNAALVIRRIIGDRRGEAQSLDDIGVVYYDISEERKALEYYARALELSQQIHDVDEQAAAFNNLGAAHDSLGEKQKALEDFGNAVPLKRASGNRKSEATTLSNMCWLEFTLSEWQSAFEHCNEALDIRHAIGDRQGQAMTLSYIGSLYHVLGDQPRSLEYYNRALIETRAAGNRLWEGIILNNIGLVSYELGDRRKAITYFDQALSIRRSVADRDGEVATLNNIGRAHDSLGESREALDSFKEGLQIARNANNRRWEAGILGNLGWLYSTQGQKQKALQSFDEALPLYRDLEDQRGEASILYGMARVNKDLDELPEALSHIESALSIIERLRTRITSQQLRSSYFASVREYYDFYIDLLMQLNRLHPTEGYDARALAANERSRARSLVESLGEARAEIREGVDQQLLERERSLQQLLDGKTESQMRLLAGNHTQEQATLIKREIEELLTEYETVEGEIRSRSPRYASLIQFQPVTLQDIQREVVDTDTILLEYALGEERSYVWAVTPSSFNAYELPKRAEIENAVKRVYPLLATPGDQIRRQPRLVTEEYSVAAATLSRIVLGPVNSLLLNRKRLLIVSDGALQYVPFAVLPVLDKPPMQDQAHALRRPLISEHEIVSLPSASTLIALRHQVGGRKTAMKVVAVLADPVFQRDDPRVGILTPTRPSASATERASEQVNSSPMEALSKERLTRSAAEVGFKNNQLRFPRLVFTRKEATSILAAAQAGTGMEALDFRANRTLATSTELSQYRIVHFATHGLLDSEHPELSGLVLSLVNERGEPQNGFLQLQDIYNLKLGADLVVLSACETALGKEIRGEGLVGLTRGFMYAGAPSVVASLWNVDDVATAELMRRFYGAMLRQGLHPAAALRQAQIEMSEQKRWLSPNYWGAFVIQGDWK